jgi:abortive infection bacteriophage resistance protein
MSFDKTFFAHPPSVPPTPNELDALALDFGAFNVGFLQKWTEYVRNLRNWCAHHARLWNRHMATPPNLGGHLNKALAVPSQHRLYHSLVMLRVMLKSVGLPDNIKQTMLSLFAKYPVASAEKARMGFPALWDTDPFW